MILIAILASPCHACSACFPWLCLHCLLCSLCSMCFLCSLLAGEQWCPLPALASLRHSLLIPSWLSSLRLHLLNRSPTACFGRAAMSLHEDARMNVAENKGAGQWMSVPMRQRVWSALWLLVMSVYVDSKSDPSDLPVFDKSSQIKSHGIIPLSQ